MFRTTKLAAAVLASAALAAATAGSAQAGYSTVEQCTTLSGTVHYTPGLVKANRAISAVITGTIDGCSGINGAQPGQGTFSATLSSPAANINQNNESGTYVINWPASSGLNPSVGVLNTTGPLAGVYNALGHNTSGAYASAAFSTSWLVTAQTLGTGRKHPVIAQQFVNTLPLRLAVNFG